MITHYKVPNFAQFSHRKYISDTKTLTDHMLKHNTLTSFGRRFYVMQGSKGLCSGTFVYPDKHFVNF